MPSSRFLPTHRLVIAVLSAAFASLIAWAFLAELDIVTTAQGKLAPISFVRVSQPSESGVVRAVHVKDGQQVEAGTLLVELDPLNAKEDVRSVEQKTERLRLQLARIDAELNSLPFSPVSAYPDLQASALTEFTLRKQALAAALSEASAAEARAQADLQVASERRIRAQQLFPLVATQAQMQEDLLAQGFVSPNAATDKRRELVDARQEQATQEGAVRSSQAGLTLAKSTTARVLADYKRQLATERSQAQGDLGALHSDLAKTEHRLSQLSLRAPVAGVVNRLASLSPGQVVNAGVALLTVVPKDEPLQFEGWVRNEDAAYVLPGMAAKVKLAAYPFQKYGWIEADVSWIGVDSETPDSMRNAQGEPLFYRMRLQLKSQALTRDGKAFDAKPGMQATGDVQVGKRTLAEYLISPLKKVALEAAREK